MLKRALTIGGQPLYGPDDPIALRWPSLVISLSAHALRSMFDVNVVLHEISLQSAIRSPPAKDILGRGVLSTDPTVLSFLASHVDLALYTFEIVVVSIQARGSS